MKTGPAKIAYSQPLNPKPGSHLVVTTFCQHPIVGLVGKLLLIQPPAGGYRYDLSLTDSDMPGLRPDGPTFNNGRRDEIGWGRIVKIHQYDRSWADVTVEFLDAVSPADREAAQQFAAKYQRMVNARCGFENQYADSHGGWPPNEYDYPESLKWSSLEPG